MAKVIEELQMPALVLAHNKTLAAQLYSEFKEFFPDNAVEYFVSYYDYYQPEAYIPQSDLYIEKDSSINDEIDRLRHAATSSLLSRKDVIIVASVSCIYGLGSPEDYESLTLSLKSGDFKDRNHILRRLVGIQYSRNDLGFTRGTFRVRGDVIEIIPVYGENIIRIELFGDEVEKIVEVDPLTGEIIQNLEEIAIYPATHYITSEEKMKQVTEEVGANFINHLPSGYDAEVTERGLSLSLGERQLLSFARALAVDPDMLILDEATASIDTETEANIQRILAEAGKDRTTVIIAHRLSTVRNADKILVLHKGKLEEQGTHDELLVKKGLYYKLYQYQTRESTLASYAAQE
jgi:transcription-repair coupling factor (superfamily II helicase)